MDSRYDVAQICLNGHVTNAHVREHPEDCEDFCEKCGQRTIMKCSSCGSAIRGEMDGLRGCYRTPAFCISCGKAFAWTEARVHSAIELAQELDALDDSDRDLLRTSLDDLLAETPRTQLAAARFKRLMVKVGKQGAELFRQVLDSVLAEAAKKAIWGG